MRFGRHQFATRKWPSWARTAACALWAGLRETDPLRSGAIPKAGSQDERKEGAFKKIKINFLKNEDVQGTTLDMTDQAMDWQELTNLTRGRPFVVERVRLAGSGVAIEGEFELPQLAQLNVEDQVFVTAFVRCHGSIKEMERIFGVSYPTIKSRLNRITQMLDFVETNPAPSRADVIDRLRRGEITAQQALTELEGRA